MAIIKTISDLLWGMPLIVLILLAGIIFTVGSKFFQIAHLKHNPIISGGEIKNVAFVKKL